MKVGDLYYSNNADVGYILYIIEEIIGTSAVIKKIVIKRNGILVVLYNNPLMKDSDFSKLSLIKDVNHSWLEDIIRQIFNCDFIRIEDGARR